MNLETIIGLEIHVQPKTKSKMFCSDANMFNPDKPNVAISPISLGHPGILPVLNRHAVELGVRASLALGLQVNLFSKFDRKSYYYPDLPKGYQISQFDQPLASEGSLEFFVGGEVISVGIERLHLEEDAAKNIHEKDYSLIDYNRSGAPLMEIVSKPDIPSPIAAKYFLQEVRLIMRAIGVSDADMEKGQLRCDANISLRPIGEDKLYPKTEIKNLNSFRSVERALVFEQKRQTELWEQGNPPTQETTRGWDENSNKTIEQRTKEGSSDYRYFPEPDIPPLVLEQSFVDNIKNSLPELPQSRRARLIDEYAFKLEDVLYIAQDKDMADYIEKVISELRAWLESQDVVEGTAEEIWENNKSKLCKLVSGWVLSKALKLINDKGLRFSDMPISAENFAEFLTLIFTKKVNSTSAQIILEKMFATGGDPSDIMEAEDLGQSSTDDDMEKWVDAVIVNNAVQVAEYKAGKEPVLKFLLGMVMKEAKGKADPVQVEELLRNKLNN